MPRSRLVSIAPLLAFLAYGCSGTSSTSGFGTQEGTDGSAGDGSSSGNGLNGGDDDSGGSPGNLGSTDAGPQEDTGAPQLDATTTITTTIYANTDDSLYSMDPKTKAVTLIGKFAGLGGGTGDTSITDCAVNAAGDVYVNSESVVYHAALPSAAGGTVQLTKVAAISLKSGQRFYALAFAPLGVLGAGEALVGGDGNGELWSIDPTSGATRDLGNFGGDPNDPKALLALSGDIVFYVDAQGKATGMATIRSCAKSGTKLTCSKTSDYLAGIDMTALAAAFTSGTPAQSLLGGVYGGSSTSTGSGTGKGDLFGVGAWEGFVYAFARAQSGTSGSPAALYAIDTTSGAASSVPGTFSFTNGWSGAGVTTKVTISIPSPPPPPPQPPPPK